MSKNGTAPAIVIDDGDTAWMLVSTALVMLMVPGLGFFYSGMARSKNALSLLMLSMLSLAVVSVQWWLWGYSLTFSLTGGVFIGDFRHVVFRDVNETRASVFEHIPSVVFAIFQCMFAAVTPALVIGSSAERARILPTAVFIFVWATLVYDPIARWTWSPAGWSFKEGVLDFAGGTPVHIASGAAALAHSIMVGRRLTPESEDFKPHNIANTVLGTTMLWFGWFGFNGGSAFGANARAGMAMFITNLSASIGGMTWMMMDYRLTRKMSAVSFCSGAVAGLVCITPGSGYVGPASAVLYGVAAGVCCNLAVKLKYLLRFDDALDVFAVHAVGGFIGNVFTGIFAESKWAELNETVIPGGWIDGHPGQLPVQLYGSLAGLGYSFTVTTLILFVMNKIPGLKLRASGESEIRGIDDSDMGEFAYYHVERLAATSHSERPVSEGRLSRARTSTSTGIMMMA